MLTGDAARTTVGGSLGAAVGTAVRATVGTAICTAVVLTGYAARTAVGRAVPAAGGVVGGGGHVIVIERHADLRGSSLVFRAMRRTYPHEGVVEHRGDGVRPTRPAPTSPEGPR